MQGCSRCVAPVNSNAVLRKEPIVQVSDTTMLSKEQPPI